MAQHLDLEEQEQLANLKHFWNTYGNLITWALIVVFGAIAAYNGWNWWQRKQSAEASAMYDEVERAAQAKDMDRVQRAWDDVRKEHGRTTSAQQAGLLAARALYDAGKTEQAREALAWLADNASDEGLKAVARLRLAAVLADAKQYDEALKRLEGDMPGEFAGLAADRRGDILLLQGKREEAKAQFTKALQLLEARVDYRRLIEVKLAALGGVPAAPSAAAPGAPATAAPAASAAVASGAGKP